MTHASAQLKQKEQRKMKKKEPREKKENQGRYLGVPVGFRATLTIHQLKDMLYKIESYPKFFLTVQEIRLRAAGPRESVRIRCDMTVSGIMKIIKE